MTIADDPQAGLFDNTIDDDLLRGEIEEWFELDDRMAPLRKRRRELKERIDKAALEYLMDGEGQIRVGPYTITVEQQQERTVTSTSKEKMAVGVKRDKAREHQS